jgi:hypothetical protein
VDGEVRTAEAEAKDFLRELLADGPVPVEEVFEEARSVRIAEKTLRRAKSSLGVDSEREGNIGKRGGGRWLWVLPTNGHLNGRIDDADTKDAVSEVAGALQQLFDHNPERREYASEQLAMELYYSDYLDQEPSYETVTAAMKMLDSVSSRA